MNKKMTFKCQILKFHDIHLANGFCLISPTNLYEKANNSLRIIDNIKKKKCTHEKKKNKPDQVFLDPHCKLYNNENLYLLSNKYQE